MITLGIDTSNYTTSIAFFDGNSGVNESRLLPVRQGDRFLTAAPLGA